MCAWTQPPARSSINWLSKNVGLFLDDSHLLKGVGDIFASRWMMTGTRMAAPLPPPLLLMLTERGNLVNELLENLAAIGLVSLQCSGLTADASAIPQNQIIDQIESATEVINLFNKITTQIN